MSRVRRKKPEQVVRLTARERRWLAGLVRRGERTGRRIVLVLDNGGAFTSRASTAAIEAAKPHVRVFWLPRYTSETLNWIEVTARRPPS